MMISLLGEDDEEFFEHCEVNPVNIPYPSYQNEFPSIYYLTLR